MEIKRAFFDNIQAMFDTLPLREKDVIYMGILYEEIKDRVKKLTPRRRDLHSRIDSQMDTEIFRNMLRYNAISENDINGIINMLFETLLGLCAPSQDTSLRSSRDRLLCSDKKEIGVFIADFLKTVHEELDEIYKMIEMFHKTSTKSH